MGVFRYRIDLSYAGAYPRGGIRNIDLDHYSAPPQVESKQPLLPPQPADAYSIQDIVDDGCFLDRDALATMVQRLEEKQNIILQGRPGAGKT